jgi:carbonic anhydrase
LKKLIQGIIDFRKNRRPDYAATFARLALGQRPDTLLIACSDSRVAPNLFASTEPGDMFVLRNVGNLIAPCGKQGVSESDESEAAAMEFAVSALQVKDIVVCGHSSCGAMRALLDESQGVDAPHFRSWLRHGAAARERWRAGQRMAGDLPDHDHVSQLNVLLQLEHLRSYAVVRDAERQGRITLHGWWFDIANADVLAWTEGGKKFVVVDDQHI